ncbi:MAG: nicotinate (nicotinamide) nucleotide adenylyltransferase [Chloroflexi bacterium]|nr:nicotinate (nicotinamide) nucleotide adenylyltransferase [Chloroflexota bacterium]
MRLGILGGTFDPVHRGHLVLARAAGDEVGLEKVMFVPAGQPWRKAGRMIASGEDRLAMLQLALGGEAAFEIGTLEMGPAGPSYTVDTLEALRADRPDDELVFILGEDALGDLPNWHRPERILELAKLAVARRADVSREALEGAGRRLSGLLERVVWLEMPLVEVSATGVRERARRGLPLEEMVPAAVADYIRQHRLYGG